MSQIKQRGLLPESFPMWWGVLGAIVVIGLAYLLQSFSGAFAGREYFSLIPAIITAVAVFYLITVLGNARRMQQRGRDIPDFQEVAYADTPDWFKRSVSEAHSPEKSKQVSALAQIYSNIEQFIQQLRSAIQMKVGWTHLLPIASVAVAFVFALAKRNTNNAYLPLEVASVEAILCIFVMYVHLSVCNATLDRWKLALQHYVKQDEESRWGEFNTGEQELWKAEGGSSPPGPGYGEGGDLGVNDDVDPSKATPPGSIDSPNPPPKPPPDESGIDGNQGFYDPPLPEQPGGGKSGEGNDTGGFDSLSDI